MSPIVIGDLLRILRGDRSLREVEKESGISNAYYSQLEQGKIGSMSVETLIKLTNYYPNHRKLILEIIGLTKIVEVEP